MLQACMGLFAVVISVAVLLTTAFAWGTWAHFTGMHGFLPWEAGTAAIGIAFIVTSMIGFRYTSSLLRAVYTVCATWIGALNYALWASVLCWIVLGVTRLAHLPLSEARLASALFGLGLVVTIYGLINAAWLRVTRITVVLPNLPPAWEGKTAALVTDLHLGHISGPSFVRQIVRRLRDLGPEIVFISGDLFDGTPIGLDRLVADWRNFSPPLGIYYVTGNHDEFAERSLYLNAVERTGIRILHNAQATVAGLQIVGVHDSEASDPAALRRILRSLHLDPSRPSILLSHRPGNLAVAEAEGIDLQLSGHTHEGQFFPWNLVVHRVWGRFAYGLNRLGKLWVYTSSGAGTWGPPLRVGTKSEVVLIELRAQESATRLVRSGTL